MHEKLIVVQDVVEAGDVLARAVDYERAANDDVELLDTPLIQYVSRQELLTESVYAELVVPVAIVVRLALLARHLAMVRR